jgi:hypothetical protein
MHSRTLLIILNAGVFILLLVLTMEAAGIKRSLRRIEHEERRLVTHCVAIIRIIPCFKLNAEIGVRGQPAD